MDNPSRSERSRNAALEAALATIARDGPGRLTLDAIARESGLSKGGLMHQFRTKDAVLKALLDRQVAYFQNFSRSYMEEHGAESSQPELASQIATSRETLSRPHSAAFAILAALGQDPELLIGTREIDAGKVKAIKAEAADPQLALLRWSAARGLALTAMFGLCPLSDKEREQLFHRLLDDSQWTVLAKPATQAKSAKPPKLAKPRASRAMAVTAKRR
ncbi:MAG: TetR/AcrR family transcriptional regulator [Tardiphaga sp.]|nr:TetR/AcrR family transcriptional regulator [Tardiphaga sp.]